MTTRSRKTSLPRAGSKDQVRGSSPLGRWRIVEMELWDREALDLLGPAQLALERGGSGRMNFIAVELSLDHEPAERDGHAGVEFTFDGFDEGDRVSGRGWAILDGQQLRGRILFHQGDGSAFVARRLAPVASNPPKKVMKLTRDRSAILGSAEVRLLDRELRRALAAAFPGLPDHALGRSEDTLRWSAVSAYCKEARGVRGIRDVSVASGIPQYQLKAIESGLLSEIRPGLARRYFRFLRVEEWIDRWCRANRDLATRAGLLDATESASSTRRRAGGRRRLTEGPR